MRAAASNSSRTSDAASKNNSKKLKRGAHRVVVDVRGALRTVDVRRHVRRARHLAARLSHLLQVRLLTLRERLALRALVDARAQAAAKQQRALVQLLLGRVLLCVPVEVEPARCFVQ